MSGPKTPPVPVGIQRLLRLAATDPAFRAQLFDLRDGVAAAAGVELTATERAVLRAASAAQLEAMALHLALPASARRDFIRQTAATAAALLGGTALLACDGCTRGSRPDVPPAEPPPTPPEGTPKVVVPEVVPEDAGSEPEPERPEHNDMHTKGGSAPDEPPPPIRPPGPTRGITADVPPKPRKEEP